MAALSALKQCRVLCKRSTLIQTCFKHQKVASHYDVLEITRSATAAEIKNAYIKKTKELHPDKFTVDEKDNGDFLKVQEAYNILSKEQERKDYDNLIFAAEDYQKYRQLRYGGDDDYLTMRGPTTINTETEKKFNVFYLVCILLMMLWVSLATAKFYRGSVTSHQIAASRHDWDKPVSIDTKSNVKQS